MMSVLESECIKEYVVKVPYDADLLLTLNDAAKKLNVTNGFISVIGALRKAVIYYYLQEEKTFHKIILDQPLEIASGIGNIAVKDDKLIVHCHVVLADKDGKCFGGHLAEGSKVFAGEVYIRALSPKLNRKYDEQTGLNIFDLE